MTGHCPAMKIGAHQTNDGWKVTFIIPMDAAPADLTQALLGTKYMLAYAPYTEEEKAPDPVPAVEAKSKGAGGLSRPAAGAVTQRERYAAMSEGEKAVARAGMLCGDPEFQKWIEADSDPAKAAAKMRNYLNIQSRSMISDPAILPDFWALETAYLMATGRIAEARK